MEVEKPEFEERAETEGMVTAEQSLPTVEDTQVGEEERNWPVGEMGVPWQTSAGLLRQWRLLLVDPGLSQPRSLGERDRPAEDPVGLGSPSISISLLRLRGNWLPRSVIQDMRTLQ